MAGYFPHLDPNSPMMVAGAILAEQEEYDLPTDWDTAEQDPEVRTLVPAYLVSNPHEGFVRRYGNDDPGRYFPGVDGE